MTDDRRVLDDPSDIVASRLKVLRKRAGWSTTKAFAQRCAAVGIPEMTASVLMNIESGRRKAGRRRRQITVDELFALAWALGVAPIALLFPMDADQPYPITPDIDVPAERAYRWTVGALAPPLAVRTGDENPFEHGSQVGRYLTERATYMPVSLDPSLTEKFESQEKVLRELIGKIEEIRERDGATEDQADQGR